MLLLMGTAAIFGVLLNLFVPGPIWVRAVLGYAFCALMMNIVAADMTPMLSAAILPVLLGTREWVYPVAVVVLVSLVCLGQIALEHAGLREPLDYHPFRLPKNQAFTSWMKRLAVFAAISAPAYFLNQPFFAVPPLLVAYTELTRPDFTLRLRPRKGWCALAGAAMTGSLARAAVEAGALPLELALALAFVGLILIWNGLRCWLPPAGAGLLLAFLVPYHGPLMYGLEAAAGAAVWVAVAVWGFDGIRPSRETHEELHIRPSWHARLPGGPFCNDCMTGMALSEDMFPFSSLECYCSSVSFRAGCNSPLVVTEHACSQVRAPRRKERLIW